METYKVVSECVSHKVMNSMAGSDFPISEVCEVLFSGWVGAFTATTFVSVLPNVFLFMLPNALFTTKPGKGLNWSNILLCFAVAGLLGDVFLHILPHMLGAHDHAHHGDSYSEVHAHHDHLDRLGHDHHGHQHGHDHHDHHDDHDHVDDAEKVCKGSCGLLEQTQKSLYDLVGLERSLCIQLMVLFGFLVFFAAEKLAKAGLGHNHDHDHSKGHSHDNGKEVDTSKTPKKWHEKLNASGWLNLLADMMHNFTDGIAIGASFASGRGLAIATFISVILHEIPHEIGDFAILMNNGLSKFEAIRAQFLTAIGAFLGTFVGLLAQRNPVFEDLFLAFTSGGFIYIATVGAMSQIVQGHSSLLQICCEIISFVLGVLMMLAVTFFE